MAGSKVPSSGSLRKHASDAKKAPSSKMGLFPTKSAVPELNRKTFVGDDSDSDSSSSSGSDSESDAKESTAALQKRVAQSSQTLSKSKTTPVGKSPTVNGLTASIKKDSSSSDKKVKQEDTSSESESESGSEESESSSDEEDTKKPVARKSDVSAKAESTPEETTSSSGSDSESEEKSDKVTKATPKPQPKPVAQPPAKTPTKTSTKTTQPAKKAFTSSESESEESSSASTSESESESESEKEDDSEDAAQQIEEQIKNDVQIAKSKPSRAESSMQEPSKKKAKHARSPSVDEDGDVEMMDRSTALTNGGNPTEVGDVPEFVAPDFHLRKVDGSIKADDVAKFFSKAQVEGKQVWYITAPASLPVTVVQDLTIPMDKAQKGLPVLSHKGDDYRLAFENPAASSSFRLLIPNTKGDEYSMLNHEINQTIHFTRSETFPPGGPASVTTTQTVSTTKPARPQPEGLRARYTPLGVRAPEPTLPAHVGKAVAQDNTATTSTSSKKKRKHRDDGEDGSAATTSAIITPVVPTAASNKKNNSTENSAKKQKTGRSESMTSQSSIVNNYKNRHSLPALRKETPVPLPPMVHFPSATQPAPGRPSSSPTRALPATQAPVTHTPAPIPVNARAEPKIVTPPSAAAETELTPKERKQERAIEELGKKDKAEKKKKSSKKDKTEQNSGKKIKVEKTTPKKVSQIPLPSYISNGSPS